MRQKTVRKTLSLVLFAEFVAGVVLAVRMLPTFPADSVHRSVELPMWVSVFICLVVGVVWIGATAVGAWRANGGWVRGSALTIHILIIAAGTGVLQGIMGDETALGLWLIVFGVLGAIGAIIWKPLAKPSIAPEGDGQVAAR